MRRFTCDICPCTVENSLGLKEIATTTGAVVEVCMSCYEGLVMAGFFKFTPDEQRKILSELVEENIKKRISKQERLN